MNLTMKQFHEALNVHLASMAPDWRVQLIVYSDGQAMSRIGLVHEDGQERSFNFAPTRVDTARANPMHLYRLAQSIAALIYGFGSRRGGTTPKPAPLVVQDPTGDDVAPDAFTTTGGKSLDDVIEDCKYPRHPDE